MLSSTIPTHLFTFWGCWKCAWVIQWGLPLLQYLQFLRFTVPFNHKFASSEKKMLRIKHEFRLRKCFTTSQNDIRQPESCSLTVWTFCILFGWNFSFSSTRKTELLEMFVSAAICFKLNEDFLRHLIIYPVFHFGLFVDDQHLQIVSKLSSLFIFFLNFTNTGLCDRRIRKFVIKRIAYFLLCSGSPYPTIINAWVNGVMIYSMQ